MKYLLPGFLALILSSSALAVDAIDTIGIMLDSESTQLVWDTTVQTSAPFETLTLYVMIAGPTLGGVSGFECCVIMEGEGAIAWNWSAGSLIPEPIGSCFQAGFPVRSPNTSDMVMVAYGTGIVRDPTDVLRVKIQGVPGSASFPDSPGYAGPSSGDLMALAVPNGDNSVASFVINGLPIANESMQWSQIKSLYR
jgi:hypothetical protein